MCITNPTVLSQITRVLLPALQRSQGNLDEAQARSVLIGVGPQVPPPQMQGLETKVPTSINSSWTHNPAVRWPRLHNCDLRDAKDLKESLRGPISDTVPFLYLGFMTCPHLHMSSALGCQQCINKTPSSCPPANNAPHSSHTGTLEAVNKDCPHELQRRIPLWLCAG